MSDYKLAFDLVMQELLYYHEPLIDYDDFVQELVQSKKEDDHINAFDRDFDPLENIPLKIINGDMIQV